MPRNLGKLRFRAPRQLAPPNLSRFVAGQEQQLQNRLRAHALDQSKPQTPLSMHIVVNPQWKQQPGKKPHRQSFKPHTVRDLVDPEGVAEHGQIIYVFANIKTGQVIYSLNELLDQYHLKQLPFLGKHSKPEVIRPDEWAPHCAITFPLATQGRQAFRKLREFRQLHETSWDKTNPEWIRLPPRVRMYKIMDQVKNTSADLAEVLQIQRKQGIEMRRKMFEREKISLGLMKKMWEEAEALVRDDKDNCNPKWLEEQIRKIDFKLGAKRNRDEADVKRLESAKKSHEIRLRRVVRARRKMQQLWEVEETAEFLKTQEEHAIQAAPAKAAGAQERLDQLKKSVAEGTPFFEGIEKEGKPTELTLAEKEAEIAKLEYAFHAKLQAETRDHPVTRDILPPEHKKPLVEPYSMDVEIKWADLRNAEYAADNWPEAVVHDNLNVRSSREGISFLNEEQYQASVKDEVQNMIKGMEQQALRAQGLYEEVVTEAEKTGVWKYLPEVKNPFKRAEA